MRRKLEAGVMSVVGFLLALAGPAAAGQACSNGLREAVEHKMVFGLMDRQGNRVTGKEWRQFLDEVITPRLSEGVTVYEGQSQWSEYGKLAQVPVKVVLAVVSSAPAQSTKLVDEISNEFAKRFRQSQVYHIAAPACAGLVH